MIQWKYYRKFLYKIACWHEVSDVEAQALLHRRYDRATPAIRRMMNGDVINLRDSMLRMEEFYVDLYK